LFHDALLKIERADKHITDLESIVSSLPDRDVISTEIDPKTGGSSIKHHIPGLDGILTDLSLIAGDAVHNLRVSLDYAWLD